MITNIFKFILGIFLAIAILAGGGIATALYFMNRASVNPPKPIYSNDQSELKAKAEREKAEAAKNPKAKPTATAAAKPTANTTAKATEKPDPTPTPTETPEISEELPPGAYTARVTWQQGLSLRSQPQADAERAGGVAFNQPVIVLEESDDKAWQKIRIRGTSQEGWVKAGNIRKVDESSLEDENNSDNQDNQDNQDNSNEENQ